MRIVQTSTGRIPDGLSRHPTLTARAVSDAVWQRDGADDHWLAVRDGVAVARASLWWHHVPSLPGQTLGLIGHYAAADPDAGAFVLNHAASALAARGCTTAVGPIDGSTWRTYRLVVERGDLAPFFLEPDTPDDWPAHFRAAGFDVLATYTSALVDRVLPPSARVEETAQRLDASGYVIRAVDLPRIDRELDALYDVSIAAFAPNYLYTPIARDEFRAHYSAILPYVDPRLVLLAEHGGRVVGYVFLVPDLLEAKRSGRATTAILKTLAVHPDHAGVGLGGLLVDRGQRAAAALGLTRVIHALMLESNVSQRISRHYGAPCRRYALFARALP